MPKFPSVEWFEALGELVNKDEEFRHFGTVDTTVGVKVADQLYLITFEAFEFVGVREIQESDLRDVDFWLEQSPEKWREMLENTKEHGAADLTHTLNTLDLNMPEGFARSHDGYRRDAFYRFNQSLQLYFDSAAKIDTEFAVAASSS